MTINERIIELGFKQFSDTPGHARYRRRNVEITVQDSITEWNQFNIYVEVHKHGHDIELSKHGIKDVDKAIKLIKKFIKKEVGR